jgi:hypothetical protein
MLSACAMQAVVAAAPVASGVGSSRPSARAGAIRPLTRGAVTWGTRRPLRAVVVAAAASQDAGDGAAEEESESQVTHEFFPIALLD